MRWLIYIFVYKNINLFAGAFLPPPQDSLEAKYKEELMTVFGIEFNQLFTMTNMPIKRFADFLWRRLVLCLLR